MYSMVRGNMASDELMFILRETPFQNILAQMRRPDSSKSAPPSQQRPTENYKILFLKTWAPTVKEGFSPTGDIFVFKGNYIFVCCLDHKMVPIFFLSLKIRSELLRSVFEVLNIKYLITENIGTSISPFFPCLQKQT